MGIPVSILLLAAGAILAFAITGTTSGVNIHAVGWILMAAGVLGLVLSLIMWDSWAGGGFLSTTEDLVAFGEALLEGRLLKPETLRLLWTSQKTSDGKDTEYGMGWGVRSDKKGRRLISHSGGAQGGTAFLLIYPDERLVMAMLVNSDDSFTGKTPELALLFLDGVEEEPK